MSAENYPFEEYCSIHYNLSQNGCLCSTKHIGRLKDGWMEMFDCATANADSNSDFLNFQLLNSSLLVLIEEKQIQTAKSCATACAKVMDVSKFIQEKLWSNLVKNLCSDRSMLLDKAIIKMLVTNFYVLPPPMTSSQISHFFEILKSDESELSKENFMILIMSIVQYDNERVNLYDPNDEKFVETFKKQCKEQVPCSLASISESKHHGCMAISNHWMDFIETQCKAEESSENLIPILDLWISINVVIAQNEYTDLHHMFLNPKHILHFFRVTPGMELLPLRIYLEVMVQIMSASLDSDLYLENKEVIEEAMIDNMNSGWLEKICAEQNYEGFCGLMIDEPCDSIIVDGFKRIMKGTPGKSTTAARNISDCNDTCVKKVSFIILKLLVGVQNRTILCQNFEKIESFVQSKLGFSKRVPAHFWILYLYFDTDDLLLGAMLAALKLYLNLEHDVGANDSADADVGFLKETINPHKMFIEFIVKVGYDHHLLLEFLMSNETACILLYLLHYLKLMLREWKDFLEAHKGPRFFQHNIEFKMDRKDDKKATPNFPTEAFASKSYESVLGLKAIPSAEDNLHDPEMPGSSSTSDPSSGNESPDINIYSLLDDEVRVNVSKTMLVITKLRQSLEKLTESNNFPYRIQPLIDLMKRCEFKYLKST